MRCVFDTFFFRAYGQRWRAGLADTLWIPQSDRQLSKYLPIIRDAPAYPIIYDSKDRVLSMPPIINSERESFSPQTKSFPTSGID